MDSGFDLQLGCLVLCVNAELPRCGMVLDGWVDTATASVCVRR